MFEFAQYINITKGIGFVLLVFDKTETQTHRDSGQILRTSSITVEVEFVALSGALLT